MSGLKSITIVTLISLFSVFAQAEKEWTLLVYVNGHNNLAPFTDQNVIDMEKVGSTADIDIVVEWGSRKTKLTSFEYSTKRLYIQKSKNPNAVTSPVVQELKNYDMGDYRNLQSFIEWGMKTYPAKHYFVVVANHGAGWHKYDKIKPLDISFDDATNSFISTEQMGIVLSNIKNTLGQNIDIFGSDACLMQMVEVIGEMKDSVDYVVGSQELEPGEGWPYEPFLQKWTANPKMTPREVSILLSQEYDAAYDGGVYGYKSKTTFSAIDVSKMDALYTAMGNLTQSLIALQPTEVKKIKMAALSTTHFNADPKDGSYDYVDLSDFMNQIRNTNISSIKNSLLDDVQARVKNLVLTSDNNEDDFPNATGISVWLPTKKNTYQTRYDKLQSSVATEWNKLTKLIVQ